MIIAVNSYEDLPSWVVDYYEPYLFWVNVILCAIIALIFLQNYKKNEASKTFAFGLFVFGFCFTIARAIENYRKFYIASDRIDISKGWVLDTYDPISGLNLFLRVLYYVFSWISIAIFYFETEKYVFQKKTKFIFTISSIFEGIASIALYYTEGSTQKIFLICSVAGFFVCAVAPILLYANMWYKSTGILKKSAFYAMTGLFFFVSGVMAELPESQFVVYLVTGDFLDAYVVSLIAPTSMFFGFFLVAKGYKMMFSSIF